MTNYSFIKSHSLVSQSAGVLIEFSIALPLIILIFAGLVDFGMALREQTIITEATRIGARSGARSAELLPTYTIPPGATPAPTDIIKRDLAIAAARNVVSGSGYNPDNYKFSLNRQSISSVAYVKFSISRSSADRFFLRAANRFPLCVSSVFKNEDNIFPAMLNSDPDCF